MRSKRIPEYILKMNLKLKNILNQNFKLFIQSVTHPQIELRPIMTKVFGFSRESP